MSRAIEIVIESLVLDGFGPASREAIAAATIAALGDLLRAHGLTLEAAETPHAAAPSIQLSSVSSPRAIGEGIARAVHSVLTTPAPTGDRG